MRPVYAEVTSATFNGLIRDMLHFFETGEISFNTEETLEVMKIREGAILAGERLGEWIDLTKLGK